MNPPAADPRPPSRSWPRYVLALVAGVAAVLLLPPRLGAVAVLPLAAAVIALDAAERRGEQTELRRSRELLRSIIDNSSAVIYLKDREGRFLFVNRAYERLFHATREEVEGKTVHDLFPADVADALRANDLEVLERGEAITFEERAPQDDGVHTYLSTKFPVRDESGNVYALGGVSTDITARKQAELLKDEFVSLVGHELRAPLASIRSALAVAAHELADDGGRPRRMMDVAIQSSDRLARLVDEILDAERLHSGRARMATREVEAEALVAAAVDGIRGVAHEAGVRLVCRAALGRVAADPDRIVQTLTNLIGNAVKFSPPASVVEIGAETIGAEVVFAVRDTGRGIPADRLSAIFERFEQVEAGDAREKRGLGLGLAICRAIVQQHGGRIWAESEPGKGSTFFFTLPAAGATASRLRGGVDATASRARRAPQRAGARRLSP